MMRKTAYFLNFLLFMILALNVVAKSQLTSEQVLTRLQEGNQRFVTGRLLHRDFQKELKNTAAKQDPQAVVLNCMDSRNVPELTFDQGLGEIFVIRVAGNIINDDVLGSMEYATYIAGAKLIVVMGHTGCGAAMGACQELTLSSGNVGQLLAKIGPAVKMATQTMPDGDCVDPPFIDEIAKDNVRYILQQIPEESRVIKKLIEEKKVMLMGAMYDLRTGRVSFFKD